MPNGGGTLHRALLRAGGTLIGGAVCVLIVVTVANPLVLVVLAAAFTVVAMSLLRVHYGLFTALVTPLSILLVAATTPGSLGVVGYRVGDILVGCAIAVVVGFLVLPSWERRAVPETVAGLVRALAGFA